MQQPSPTPAPGSQPKVAIPRLQPTGGGGGSSGGAGKSADRNRVLHACEPCRQKKTKCSGEKPTCQHCQHYQISCYYGDGKRDRAKNEMNDLRERLKKCEQLLESIGNIVEAPHQLAINEALGRVSFDTPDHVPYFYQHIQNLFPLAGGDVGGEALAPGDSGSTGSLDHITEDVPNKEGNPMGYVGKPSTRAWIQRAAQHLQAANTSDKAPEPEERQPSQSLRVALSDYNDDPDLSVAEDQIDPTALPPKEISDRLLATYFETVNPSFPIVRKSLFMQQYEEYYRNNYQFGEPRRWLAILNLLMAISAVYSHMVKQPQGDSRDHMQYFARARMLSFDGSVVYDQPDLQQVQVAALTSVYMITTNQLNRAWNVNGLAIRYAQTLGLNLNNESNSSRIEKDIQSRLWYSIRSLERLLAVATGRPLGVRDTDCTARLPKADEDVMTPPPTTQPNPFAGGSFTSAGGPDTHLRPGHQDSASRSPSQQGGSTGSGESSSRPSMTRGGSSSTSLSQLSTSGSTPNYFAEADYLGKITEECLLSIYSPAVVTSSRWIEVQGKIAELEAKLAKWKSQLHPILDFTQTKRDRSFVRLKMALGMQYHHLRMLINRPCLCGDSQIPNESENSKEFSRMAARACVEEARNLIRLIPRDPNPVGLTSVSPWWSLLYYLSSAGAIIILEISLKSEHFPAQGDALLDDASMVLEWLKSFGGDNAAAKASWAVLARLLHAAAPKIGRTYQTPEPSPDSIMGGIETNLLDRLEDFRPMIPSVFPNFTPGPIELNLGSTGFPEFGGALRPLGSPGVRRSAEEQGDHHETATSRMFPSPEQMMEYNLVEMDPQPQAPSEGLFGSLLFSSMNWEQQLSHQPSPPAHVLPSQHEDPGRQRSDLWIPQGGYGGMTGITTGNSPGYQSGQGEELSPQDSRIVDDTIRQRERDRRRRGSRS